MTEAHRERNRIVCPVVPEGLDEVTRLHVSGSGVRQNIVADVEGEHLPGEKGSREKSHRGKESRVAYSPDHVLTGTCFL